MTASVASGFVMGVALGAAYFVALRWNVTLYLTGERPVLALGVHLARFATLCVALVVAARDSAATLLATLGGVVVARVLLTRAWRPR